MTKTRVHELAKRYGLESKDVLEKLREMGEFVKSPSSQVDHDVEMRFKATYGDALRRAAQEAGLPLPPEPPVEMVFRDVWGEFGFRVAEKQAWIIAGLGDDQADVARQCVNAGLRPEDLLHRIDGAKAGSRLRNREPIGAIAASIREIRRQRDHDAS